MWPYDQSVHPPAPFLDIVLHHPANPQVIQSFLAKVDTGADISAIPLSIVDEFNLSRASTIPVEGYDGQLSTVPTYAIGLYIADTYLGRLEVISIPKTYVLLSRDVLNRFYIRLNGPDLTFHMGTSP
jgi:predicted aspartyl protease